MVPFHPYTDHVRDAIVEDGGLRRVDVAYFHDTPVDAVAPRLVRKLSQLAPQLDPILPEVSPSMDGLVHLDTKLLEPRALADVVAARQADALAAY